MPNLALDDLGDLLRKWMQERPERATLPRIPFNPYGDNGTGMAFDEGWWSCIRWIESRKGGRPYITIFRQMIVCARCGTPASEVTYDS